ncbi:CRISPR-associated helicase/endonuclease Cas3 [Rubrivivax gelatinosus]|uniref:CRISPR-associated helicase, Cas3 family n=1 Tax=Rubrivivax gelatinosus (strain NBRC 100245 / IL144) TaxID=983917 RepID=I0HLZ7_RUBGI|nr:CRISPR-associated helicase/endonuclease Cas3 [Rubrivivax gelatinosus]BAL94034.1 CRISPR-associated helicase, Cas3 family [Rubrivivax gelatinosus IL144]
MRFDELAVQVRAIWAKSGDTQGHGLLAHMLDVAAVAQRILEREPPAALDRTAAALGLDTKQALRTIAAWAGLHDYGKAIPGFQCKWPTGYNALVAAGLSFPRSTLTADRHDLVGTFELLRVLAETWPGHERWLARVLGAHHGHFFDAQQIRGGRRVGEPPAWELARRELLSAYLGALSIQGGARRESEDEPPLAVCAWLAGLVSVADWIGSNIEWFPLGERGATLEEHHAAALVCAEVALDAIGWPRHLPLLRHASTTDELIRAIVGRDDISARPLQSAADELLAGTHGPALLLVEAPMGEGKTELAFLAHLRLQAAVGHRGLYVALPTQATGNAMFDRTLQFLRAFGRETSLDIQLAHGGALLDDRLVELRGIHGEGAADVRSSVWFSQRRRPLLSPYGVGTVDQALFATLNVKHHFVRLWGLANRVVVLDEVHAYDTYTGGLIEELLGWLKALGCSVVLMSATLPAARREALLRRWGVSPSAAPVLPYPRLLAASDSGLDGRHFASRDQAPILIEALGEDIETIADEAARRAGGGGCGAVIVNTVARAQQLHELLRQRLPESVRLLLFHARFPADERAAREQTVMQAFGKMAARPDGALLVATQVVEQSLDIDFDFLISDLAPVDLLLQRAGRLHRHERARPPAHADARLIVAGLLAHRLPDLERTGWGSLYGPYPLYRTWAFASREAEWRLPRDIDRLVQTVYGDAPLPAGLPTGAADLIEGDAWGDQLAREQIESSFARNAAVSSDAAVTNAYSGKPGSEEGSGLGLTNQTRLGDASVTVVPIHVDDGGWRVAPDDAPFDPGLKPMPELAKRLLSRQVRLSSKAIVKELLASDPPAGFQEHPWLRDVRPLCLRGGVATVGRVVVRFDKVLGIVYERPATSSAKESAA